MTLRAALALCLLAATPLRAEEASPFAMWGANSGSLPPEYAWDHTVTFRTDRRVVVEYCKGYAREAPGCATVTRRLSKADFAALQEKLAPLAAGLLEDPPQADPNPPIGGGSSWGTVNVEGEDIRLPAFPLAEDQAQVSAILGLLRDYTPAGAVDAAERRARAP